jgi:arylsulfatase A-like enzyme
VRIRRFPEDQFSGGTSDALAARGLSFLDCSATTSWTLPSHAAIFTGEPHLVHATELDRHVLPQGLPTLAERLASRSWRTASFYSGPYLDLRFGFGRGFERYQSCYGEALDQVVRSGLPPESWHLAALSRGARGTRRQAADHSVLSASIKS